MATQPLSPGGLKLQLEEKPNETIIHCKGKINAENLEVFQRGIRDLMPESRDPIAAIAYRIRIGSLLVSSLPLSALRNTISLAPSLMPARSRTSASGTPVHSAVLTAPKFHCSPFTRGLSNERPFPAHSKVTNWV